MPEVLKPVDLGLTEFVSKLVEEVIIAIASNQSSQIEKYAELIEAANKPIELLAADIINDDMVQNEVDNLFPGIFSEDELLDINKYSTQFKFYGIELVTSKDISNGKLTESGVKKITGKIRLFLANKRRDVILEVIKQGVPSIEIDEGRISAKVNFSSIQNQTTPSGGTTARKPMGNTLLSNEIITAKLSSNSKKSQLLNTNSLPGVRIAVSQVNSSNSSGFGEIELKFRSIRK